MTTTRTAPPPWIRALTAIGRPVILGVALAMCSPGEYHLAKAAGWDDPWAYGMPVVLSAYAGIAAAVASTRWPGDRGRASAIAGAIVALSLAIAAQIVSHLIDTGHLSDNQPWLISVTSLVPPAVVGHLLHLAASPPSTDLPAEGQSASGRAEGSAPVRTPGGDLADTGNITQDAEDEPRDAPRLITSADVAERCGVDPSTVRSWVANGRLKVAEKDSRGRNLFDASALNGEVRS